MHDSIPYMSRIELSLEDRKRIGLLVLDEVRRVCRLLSMDFYLAYGTLLGAVRHKGFIPWDDDIDIWMFRKDFDIFVEKFNSLCHPDFRLWFYTNMEDYPFNMPKVCYLKTEIREKNMKRIEGIGIWVDIFPIDYLSEESKAATQRLVQLEKQRWMGLYRQSNMSGRLKLFFYGLFSKDVSLADRKHPASYYTKQIHALHACTQEHDQVRSPTSVNSYGLFYDASAFDSVLEVPFEDRTYPIPAGYDSLLRTVYHDYLQIPPKSKQNSGKHLREARFIG